MKRLDMVFESKAKRVFCAVASIAVLLSTCDLRAQVIPDSNWRSAAETRLKAIYERGEFRAKAYRPVWLSDSSGFVVEDADPATGKPTQWFHDVTTGDRLIWSSDDKRLVQGQSGHLVHGTQRLEARRDQIVAVDQISQQETVLISGPEGRDVEYRDPVWSPDGARVVFIEADYTDVKQRSVLVPGDPSYPEVQQHRFARVGGSLEKLRVGVVDADGENLKWLPVECPEEGMYLGQAEWAGNSDEVLVEQFSRFRDRRDFLLVTADGSVTTIYSEINDAWVEASQGWNSGLAWIQAGKGFIVVSEKDGWRHARRYSRDGKEIALLTSGNYDIIDRAIIDEERGWYYFYASPENGTQKYLYRVALDGSGNLQRISPQNQPGTHGYVFSPDARWAIHTYSTLELPPVHELIEVETHRVIKLLEDNHAIRETMKSISCQPAEFLKLDIGDGIVFDAWMLKPRDFDPAKKYPVFIYVYGEPHAQTVLDEWGAAQIDFHRLVAEMGYVVVSIDNRGTPAPKGAAWRRAIFGSLGPLSTEEQEAGLKALAKQCPFIDLDRVGIWGWSGGGSNTLNAMFRKPDSYHVGIAVVPKPQPHLYNAWFQEIFMRTREVNAEGYERSAPINFAEGLEGKLLIMTGSGETNTHIQIIEGLVDRLIELGKPFDYMVYPNRDHGLREGSGTVVHVRMHILRYLLQNLPSGPR
jgi:dipeptidyl-peptidase-4